VLLIDHGDEGSFGFVLNRATDLDIEDVFHEVGVSGEAASTVCAPVMLGGPVSPESGWILYDPEGVPQPSSGQTIAVGQRIACSASLELLERIARGDGPDTCAMMLGYAGWDTGRAALGSRFRHARNRPGPSHRQPDRKRLSRPNPRARASPCFVRGQRLPPLPMGFRLDRLVCIGLLALAMACGGGSASGSGKKMLDPDDDARSGYEKALLDFRRGDCLSAEPMFVEIRREFPYSRFAALAELRIGDCQFKNEAYPEAIQTYRQFVRIRPSHKEIPYARFRIAEAYYNQIPGGWFMTPPAAERDQSAARDALIQLRRFVVDYPEDQRVPDANKLMEECMGLLAAHEFYVARFYLKRDAYRGVISRLKGLLASYPGSGVEPKALLLLAEVYLKTKEVEAARQTLDEIVQRFPESAEAKKARALLGKLG
jgi:outer membrane protein assembly factor BamD